MPIYEYICGKCKHEFELLLMDRNELVKCPECGSAKANKQFSVFAHKSDSGFSSSAGSDSCAGCSAGSCSGCSSS